MTAERAADRATVLEQELDEKLPLNLHSESEFDVERESSRVRPLISSICGEAHRIRSRLLTLQGGLCRGAIVHARKWLRRTSNRWPYESLRELTRRELDVLAGCLYGVVSAMSEEPESYRQLRSDIGKRLGVPVNELEGEAELEYLRPRQTSSGESEIFPPDGRRLVPNTLLVPFRFVCCLEITFINPLDGQTVTERGTGTLISNRHVLTAAHCVFEDISVRNVELARLGRPPFPVRYLRAQNILVAPARNARVLPFGFSDVTNVRVAPGWQAAAARTATSGTHVSADPHADFALLTLATPLGRQEPLVTTMQLPAPLLGFWGCPEQGLGTRIQPIELNRLRDQLVTIAGYPLDKCRAGPAFRAATAAEIAACQGTIPGQPEFSRSGLDPVGLDRPRRQPHSRGHAGHDYVPGRLDSRPKRWACLAELGGLQKPHRNQHDGIPAPNRTL